MLTRESEMPRRALITGGASGIGAATTRLLIDRGWRVAVLDVNPETAAIAADIGAYGLMADVRSTASVDAAVATAVAELGGLDGV